LVLWAVSSLGGCTQSRFDDDPGGLPAAALNGPGSKAWANENVACRTDDDCAIGAGEACLDGVCQMRRCSDVDQTSVAPLGAHRFIASYRDMIVADADNILRGYEPVQSQLMHSGDFEWQMPGEEVTDVAGGNLLGTRPEVMATAHKGSMVVQIVSPSREVRPVDVGFEPVAIAAGDTDGDGVDELVAVAANGQGSICNALTGVCSPFALEAPEVRDVTTADVDGDGREEPIVLAANEQGSDILVVKLDAQGANARSMTVASRRLPRSSSTSSSSRTRSVPTAFIPMRLSPRAMRRRSP
jgi:hypothetical protein